MPSFLKQYGDCTGPLDFPMKEEDARELEKKLDSGEYSPIRIQKADAFEHFVEGERSDVSVITDSSVDKEGDVIDPDSIDFSKFQKNPVVAFNHRYDVPPVGKSLWQKKVNGGIWKAKTQYISKPENHPSGEVWFPDSVFHMVKSGSMKGKSIGGAVKYRAPTEEDATRLNFDLTKCKRISESVEIWEYSVCPLAMNSNAVVEMVSKAELAIDENLFSSLLPNVYEALMKFKGDHKELDVPLIKSFKTLDDLKKEHNVMLNKRIEDIEKNLGTIVNDCIRRLKGQVV